MHEIQFGMAGTVYRIIFMQDVIRIQYDLFDQAVLYHFSLSEYPEFRHIYSNGVWNYVLLRGLLGLFSATRVARLEPKLRSVYDFIVRFYVSHGFVPTVHEISLGCNLARSTSATRLWQLEAAGILQRHINSARAYRLVGVFTGGWDD